MMLQIQLIEFIASFQKQLLSVQEFRLNFLFFVKLEVAAIEQANIFQF